MVFYAKIENWYNL